MSTTTTTKRAFAALIAVAAGLALAGCSLLGDVFGPQVGTETDDGVITDVFTIKVGDCLNDASLSDGEISTVPTVPCSEPHDSEAYHAFNLADGAFPGQEAIEQAAFEGCDAAYEAFIGIAFEQSQYDWAYYFPTQASWGEGDREILCIIYDPSGAKITGSLADVRL